MMYVIDSAEMTIFDYKVLLYNIALHFPEITCVHYCPFYCRLSQGNFSAHAEHLVLSLIPNKLLLLEE